MRKLLALIGASNLLINSGVGVVVGVTNSSNINTPRILLNTLNSVIVISGEKIETEIDAFNSFLQANENIADLKDNVEIKDGSFHKADYKADGSIIISAKENTKYTGEVAVAITKLAPIKLDTLNKIISGVDTEEAAFSAFLEANSKFIDLKDNVEIKDGSFKAPDYNGVTGSLTVVAKENPKYSGEVKITIEDLDAALMDKLLNIISQYKDQPIALVEQILPLLNNKVLSSDLFVRTIGGLVGNLKTLVPEIGNYLSYLKFVPNIMLLGNELISDWDQQSNWGSTPQEAMKNYIASEKGDIAQAKYNYGGKGSWYYVGNSRAANWTWDDFYMYMAGANLNYLIKLLAGDFIGNLITKHLTGGGFTSGLDQEGFINEISSAIQKFPETPEAWPYLIKTIVPILKINILKSTNPTLGYKNLTWEANDDRDLSVKTLLEQLKHLLSPDGRDDLVKLLASILGGTAGEDIIITPQAFWTKFYYTLPEALSTLSWFSDSLKPETIANGIVDQLSSVIDSLGLPAVFEDIYQKAELGISENPLIDLQDLTTDLNKLYSTNDFQNGLDKLIEIITNPNSSITLKEIFVIWGVEKDQEDFRTDSPFSIIKKWIDDPKSILSQILNILHNLEAKGELS